MRPLHTDILPEVGASPPGQLRVTEGKMNPQVHGGVVQDNVRLSVHLLKLSDPGHQSQSAIGRSESTMWSGPDRIQTTSCGLNCELRISP